MNQQELIKKIKQGKIFIYPTDTIYGIGCDATNKQAVEKIKQIKSRDKNKPLSIIAPSIAWIKQNCITNNINLSQYLPGPYTLILKKKNPDFLKWVSDTNSLGIRIPNNKFTRQIQKSQLPFITTSVNLAGEKPAILLSHINKEIINKVDEVIKEKDKIKLSGKPSILIINKKEIGR